MSENEVAAAISIAISIVGLMVVTSLLRGYLIDSFRDQLFALRDEMFLYACDHDLFDSPAYLNLRILMNGMIRYAHRTSIGRLMALDITRRILKIPLNMPNTYAEWVVALKTLPDDQVRQLREYHDHAIVLAMKHMVQRSPMLWIGIIVLGIYFAIWRSTTIAVDRALNVFRNRMMPTELFESEAYNAAAL